MLRYGLTLLLCYGCVNAYFPFGLFSDIFSSPGCFPLLFVLDAQQALSRIQLRFYYGNHSTEYVTFPLENVTDLVNNEYYNSSRCFVLHIHGFDIFPKDDYTPVVIESHLKRHDYNFIAVDWSSITLRRLYNNAVALTEPAGKRIAEAIDHLLDTGQAEMCHMEGFSLGAQLAGVIARNMNHTVKHIIALDPAFPLYGGALTCAEPLNMNDAECVEVLHTDGGGFGTKTSLGKIDFFPNTGSRDQPGCATYNIFELSKRFTCSHFRALNLYAEAVLNSSNIVGIQCQSWEDFTAGKCRENAEAYLGQCSEATVPGNYYLKTNKRAPFARGPEGIRISRLSIFMYDVRRFPFYVFNMFMRGVRTISGFIF